MREYRQVYIFEDAEKKFLTVQIKGRKASIVDIDDNTYWDPDMYSVPMYLEFPEGKYTFDEREKQN